jgi:hypothetical protein
MLPLVLHMLTVMGGTVIQPTMKRLAIPWTPMDLLILTEEEVNMIDINFRTIACPMNSRGPVHRMIQWIPLSSTNIAYSFQKVLEVSFP